MLGGAERFLVEILRAKDDRFLGPLTIAQVISLGLIAFGLWGMARLGPAGPARGEAAKGDTTKAAAKGAQARREKRRARA